jgi:hypothetical protein
VAQSFDGGYIIKVSESYVNSFKKFPNRKLFIDETQTITYNNGTERIKPMASLADVASLRRKKPSLMHGRRDHGKDNKI